MPAKSHGFSRKSGMQAKVYRAWVHMHERCRNPNNDRYGRYGGRGISVCERWFSFPNFLEDMGFPPTSKHTLDRKENDGNYEKGNCQWATYGMQNNNKTNPGPPPILTTKIRSQVLMLWGSGLSTRKIAGIVGCGKSLVAKITVGKI